MTTSMSVSPKLCAQAVWKIFPAGRDGDRMVAVQDFSLEIGANEFVSLVGPSGCGKSTFLQIVAGLEEASRGQVLVDGKAINGPGADRGMVFQSYTLFPWLSVADNIRFGLKKSGLPRAEQEDRVQTYLRLIGLESFAGSYPNQLSGGMRQRVAIARALVSQPQMLLMDEPFGALDAQTRLSMQELLLEVWEKNRTTVLFVTHDVEEAILLSDRIYVMTPRPGRVNAVLEVNLPRPRSLLRTEAEPEFVRLKSQVLQLIRAVETA